MRERLLRGCAAEEIVAHRAAHEAHPGALEYDRAVIVENVAARADIELERLRVHERDRVVERVDPLENGDLVFLQAQRSARLQIAALVHEVVARHKDTPDLREHGKMLVQKLHVHTQGRLKIVFPFGRARRRFRGDGYEIVVHGDAVRAYAALLKHLADLQRGRRLAAAGGTGEQHDRAFFHVFHNAVGGKLQPAGVNTVALGDESGGIGTAAIVDLGKIVGHISFSLSVRIYKSGRSRPFRHISAQCAPCIRAGTSAP